MVAEDEKTNPKNAVRFFFEAGMLKKIKHEGWRHIGIENPESVAEHSLRAAQIAYVLALMERAPEPYEACAMAVFHDIGECRTGDVHKVGSIYVKKDESHAVLDQTEHLGNVGKGIFHLWHEFEEMSSVSGRIAKDADFLELAITGREYMERGFPAASVWIDNAEKGLFTNSAKMLMKELRKADSNAWWKQIKGIIPKRD